MSFPFTPTDLALVGAKLPVDVIGNVTYSPEKNATGRPWNANRPFDCHADLLYENDGSKNINGPLFNITSIAGQTIATTYAAQYTTTGLPPHVTAASSTSTPSATPTGSPSPSATPPPPPSDSGLSTGATAGIAVGVIAGVGALAFLGFMVWRNKRKVDKLQSRIPGDDMDHYSKPQGVEVAQPYQDDVHQGAYAPTTKYAMEADNRQSVYAGNDTAAAPVELEPLQPPQELPGSNAEARRQ